MSLPYPSMTFVPFDILTAAEMNQLVANDQALAAGTGLDSGAITGDKISNYKIFSQSDTTNTTENGVKLYSGWGQILGNGSNLIFETVTLPSSITRYISMNVNFIGYKSGGASAADMTQFDVAVGAGNIVQGVNRTTTNFIVAMSSTGTFGAVYHGYSWTVMAV